PEHTSYYAKVDEQFGSDDPRGLVRRRHTVAPIDEYFGRDGAWHPTEYLVRYALGHNDVDHVEITPAEALIIMERWTARWAAERAGS
ncbi:MAG: hypothetical protein ACRDQB_04205, partial [Thermocrispum sp.]